MLYIALDGTTHLTLDEVKSYNKELMSGHNS
jgi:hypothetical protein